MSNDVMIRAEGLGKKYVIGHQSQERVPTLRDAMVRSLIQFGRGATDILKGNPIIGGDKTEDFWALRGLDFEVGRGDVVGIIGRNGAGKSTLLKVLSRITEPTEGRVEIKGRVASLLEVGTGFHPELSGRENIYLNGAILGMSRQEIGRKFNEIVEFSGVEKFLDTPVKRYSSGMYVRLAFAVAAHLEPEILVVDEVLAVGDAEFQKKCLGKMQDVAGQGRTVLFVSHNMAAMQRLCPKSCLLEAGRLTHFAPTDQIIQEYTSSSQHASEFEGTHFGATAILSMVGAPDPRAVQLSFEIRIKGPNFAPRIGIGLNDGHGNRIGTVLTEATKTIEPVADGEARSVTITLEPLRLKPGQIRCKIALAEGTVDIETAEDALVLEVPDYNPFEFHPRHQPGGSLYITFSLDEA